MRDAWCMTQTRTTLAIDDDVLTYAREQAKASGSTIGEVVSELARSGMTRSPETELRNGVRLLPRGAKSKRATLEDVNRLRDELL